MRADTPLAKWQHILSGAIHISSAIGILVSAAYAGRDHGGVSHFDRPLKSKPSENAWLFRCANATDDEPFACDARERTYYISATGTVAWVPVIPLAFIFAFWSGIWHVFSAWRVAGSRTTALDVVVVRTIDYVVSSALMIAVVNTLFGASTYVGVIASPLLQAGVVLLGGSVEYDRDHSQRTRAKWWYVPCALGAFSLYALVWYPVFLALTVAASSTGKAPNAGVAPPPVWIFLIATMLIFSSFAAIWVWFLACAPNTDRMVQRREFAYNTVSCIAKVTLHAFIGIALFAQRERVAFSENDVPDEPPDTTEQEVQAYVAVTSVIAGVGVLNLCLWLCWKYRPAWFPANPPSGSNYVALRSPDATGRF